MIDVNHKSADPRGKKNGAPPGMSDAPFFGSS